MQKVLVGKDSIIPSKVVCIGRNYHAHIEELKNEVPDSMVLFSKPNSSISSQLRSYHQEPLHYEGEICLLVKNHKFSAIGFGLDLTKRSLQSKLKTKGLPWERAKAFNGSAVFSRFVEIAELPTDISFELMKNGKLVQAGNRENMIYQPESILLEVLSFMDLNDGDILMTGTPKGVGEILKGDAFSVTMKTNAKTILEDSWVAE